MSIVTVNIGIGQVLSNEEQDKVISLFKSFGFRYDGFVRQGVAHDIVFVFKKEEH